MSSSLERSPNRIHPRHKHKNPTVPKEESLKDVSGTQDTLIVEERGQV